MAESDVAVKVSFEALDMTDPDKRKSRCVMNVRRISK